MKIIELVKEEYNNHKYGKLTIQYTYKDENRKTISHCICDCGNIKDALFYNIRKGATKSCGCMEKESRYGRNHTDMSIIGKRFGRLIVVNVSNKKASNGAIMWECLCDCGKITYSNSSNLKRGHTTSCGCAKKDFIESLKLDVIGEKFGCLTVIKEVYNKSYVRRMVECKCECGNICICSINDLITNHTSSCGCKFKSKGESLIEIILKELKVNYIPQYRFDTCKNIRPLPFDFYLPDYNICIEYQGQQHYRPIEFWGGNEKFEERQKLDKIKSDFCKNNNIKLMCLPYTLSDNELKNILYNTLNP